MTKIWPGSSSPKSVFKKLRGYISTARRSENAELQVEQHAVEVPAQPPQRMENRFKYVVNAEGLAVAFHRAHRVPDDHDKLYQSVVMRIGHSTEPYRLFLEQNPGQGLTYLMVADPSNNASDGLAIRLRDFPVKNYAVRILAGSVDVASGVKHGDNDGPESGDYILAPPSKWIDGIECSRQPDRVVRQFVTTDLTGYSIDAQKGGATPGSESPNVFHFRVIDLAIPDEEYRYTDRFGENQFPISIKTMTGNTLSLWVHGKTTIEDVKYLIWEKIGVPRAYQRITWKGREMQNKRTVDEYGIGRDATLLMIQRLRGGGDNEYMLSARQQPAVQIWPGGLIRQAIATVLGKDLPPSPTRHRRTTDFKVEIVSPEEFRKRTGQEPPSPPSLGQRPNWDLINRNPDIDQGELTSFAEAVAAAALLRT